MTATTPDGTAANGKQPRPWKRRLRRFGDVSAFYVLVLLIILVLFWHSIVHTVPSGSVGVVWYRFLGGTDTDGYAGEGVKLTFPWDDIYLYSARPQRVDVDVPVLTKEGLAVSISITLTVMINPDTVGLLHKAVGPLYVELMVQPTVIAATRAMFTNFGVENIYNLGHEEIEIRLRKEVERRLGDKNLNYYFGEKLLNVAQLSLRIVTLPSIVSTAIEDKIAAEQSAKQYRFMVEKEKLESERKEIEAMGIKRFQEIVTPTISDQYLKWRGIDATLQLAQSPNSKIVVIGNGNSNGLPLIFDSRTDAGTPGTPSPTPTAPTAKPAK